MFLHLVVLAVALVVRCQGDYFSLLYFDCGQVSHYELGYCIGKNTKDLITKRWEASSHFQQLYEWITDNTTNGTSIFNTFLTNNQAQFPDYFDEIAGISNASSFDFNKIVMMSLDEELSYFAPNTTTQSNSNNNNYNNNNNHYNKNPHTNRYPKNKKNSKNNCKNNNNHKTSDIIDRNISIRDYNCDDFIDDNDDVITTPITASTVSMSCSDYLLFLNSSYAFDVHNEDNGAENRNVTFIVKAQVNDELVFYSYGYAGEVLTQAMGWNKYIGFSGNFVHPSTFVKFQKKKTYYITVYYCTTQLLN